jgi:hypothetical protein
LTGAHNNRLDMREKTNAVTNFRIYSPVLNKVVTFEASSDFAKFLEQDVGKLLQREKLGSVLLETLERQSFVPGIVAEFGVFSGKTINQIAQRFPGRKIHGFDSFEGLSHDWRLTGSKYKISRNMFATHGKLPAVGENVDLIKGYFEESLPRFLKEHPEPISFLHIDCDIYESTKVVFDLCEERIVSGTVIVFDEFFDYLHEARAFFEFLQRTGRKYEWLGHGGDGGIIFDSNAMNLARRNMSLFEKLINSAFRFVNHKVLAKSALPTAAAVLMA